MNKEQIIEILNSYGVFSEFIHEGEEWRNKIADEILALNSIWSNYVSQGETFDNRKITHRPGGFTIEVEHEEECSCRQCKPELWFQDERGVWCHKVQSFGDDVV